MTQTFKSFFIEYDGNMCVSRITHFEDKYQMNWVEGKHFLGETVCPPNIDVTRQLEVFGDMLTLTVSFKNPNGYDVLLRRGELGVYVPFNDSYGKASVCMTERCHAHLNMCGSSSYIMGLRMGGEPPHLGMLLDEGELVAYSIERENKSNDRGDFLLHPPFVHLLSEESYTLKLKFFFHEGREDFFEKLLSADSFINIKSEHFTYIEGEDAFIRAELCNSPENVRVYADGKPCDFKLEGGTVTAALGGLEVGEHTVEFFVDGKRAIAKIYVSWDILRLVHERCKYIVCNQQLCREGSSLDGAYLAFDTESEEFVYDYCRRDINSSRERICMALLLLLYLKHYGSTLPPNEAQMLAESLKKFVRFFKREIYDSQTGNVCNDIGYENSKIRLYNYPWPTRFFLELYELDGDIEYLKDAFKIMSRYYELGGKNFYAFTIPILKMCKLLDGAGMTAEAKKMRECFAEHAEVIITNASDYPAHEVSYEQSIVAPAAKFLLQMYSLTGDARYLAEADKQMRVAELFSGEQPDYHTYWCAIRHWDGFWFGKNRLYGDTFPHYWSVLSADAFFDYGCATKNSKYLKMAEDAFRGQLCQFSENGKATCATLYPFKVNGNRGEYKDPWANDQDWALVYYLDYLMKK